MSTHVSTSMYFDKQLKALGRKYPAVTTVVRDLVVQLENDEPLGDPVPNVGYTVYKVRLKNPSASKGKSGGFRVIYYLRQADLITLITIYSKTDQTDITPEGIRQLIEEIIPPEDEPEA